MDAHLTYIDSKEFHVADPPPLSWTILRGRPYSVCVNGHPANLETWSIVDDGHVIPSVFCRTPMPGGGLCDWHVFVHLDGWKERSGQYRQEREEK